MPIYGHDGILIYGHENMRIDGPDRIRILMSSPHVRHKSWRNLSGRISPVVWRTFSGDPAGFPPSRE